MTNNTNITTIMQQHNYTHQQEDNHDHYHNNNSAHESGRTPPDAYALIREAYVNNVCPMMTQAAAFEIESAMNAGMDVDTVLLAIHETGYAPRPSLYYLRAILRTWAETGVTVTKGDQKLVRTNSARPWWR